MTNVNKRIWSFMTRGIIYGCLLTILLGLVSPIVYHVYDDWGFRYFDYGTAAFIIGGLVFGRISLFVVPSMLLGAFLGVVIGSGTKLIVKCISILFAALVSASLAFIESCPSCLAKWQIIEDSGYPFAIAWCSFIGTCGVGLLLLTQLRSNPISAENDRDEVFTQHL